MKKKLKRKKIINISTWARQQERVGKIEDTVRPMSVRLAGLIAQECARRRA